MTKRSTVLTFIGGLGEIGANCFAISRPGGTVLIDFGTMFPAAGDNGIPRYVPDTEFILKHRDDIAAVVFTHGHEDHIGAVPLLARLCPKARIFGTALTLKLIEQKLNEWSLSSRLIEITDYESFRVLDIDLTPVPVAHNIPHGVALVIDTPDGSIFHTGDFKLDTEPIDGRTFDPTWLRKRFAGGVPDLMLCDSTNANIPGATASERSLHAEIENIFRLNTDRRILCSTFASNIHRHQAFMDAAAQSDRDIFVLGRSIERNVEIARELHILDVESGRLREASDASGLDPARSFILTTGSQAEPRSGLALMAKGMHRSVNIGPRDLVVLSSSRVPGNERAISDLVNRIIERGADVIDIQNSDIHTSGHARSADLERLLDVVQPGSLVPMHGEERHLRAMAAIGTDVGVPRGSVHRCRDGASVTLESGTVKGPERQFRSTPPVPVDDRFEVLSRDTIHERDYLGRHGVLVATVGVEDGSLHSLDLHQHGWMSGKEFDNASSELRQVVEAELHKLRLGDTGPTDPAISKVLRRALGRAVSSMSGSRPRIVPRVVHSERSTGRH